MKKSIFVLVVSICLTIAIFFLTQAFFGKIHDTGELQITSQPSAKVYLNNQYIGNTPICRCAENHGGNVLPVGDYTIQLVAKNVNSSPFFEHITIAKGVLTVVDYTFGSDGQASGSTLQLSASNNSSSSIEVTSFPSDTSVLLDENPIGNTPLVYKQATDSDHVLTIKKDGYEEKDLHIRTPAGYNLQAIVYLAVNLQPTAAATGSASQPEETATSEADMSPSPKVAEVTILDTPTGYLNVRSEASLGSDTIGQVKPGDTLLLLDEQVGWYQVKLSSTKIGWISSQYARKD